MMRDIGEDRSGELNNIVLRYGSHGTSDKGMCAMEAVAWLANEPHSDRPACTCSVIAAFVRRFNDRLRTDEDRTLLLRPLLLELIGTRSTGLYVMRQRAYLAADWSVRTMLPILFRAFGWTEAADQCTNAAPIVDRQTALMGRDIARQAQAAAAAAAAYAAADRKTRFETARIEINISAVELVRRMCAVR